MGVKLEDGWPCSGPLLRMARDVTNRLLPAFDTPTGEPSFLDVVVSYSQVIKRIHMFKNYLSIYIPWLFPPVWRVADNTK